MIIFFAFATFGEKLGGFHCVFIDIYVLLLLSPQSVLSGSIIHAIVGHTLRLTDIIIPVAKVTTAGQLETQSM